MITLHSRKWTIQLKTSTPPLRAQDVGTGNAHTLCK